MQHPIVWSLLWTRGSENLSWGGANYNRPKIVNITIFYKDFLCMLQIRERQKGGAVLLPPWVTPPALENLLPL